MENRPRLGEDRIPVKSTISPAGFLHSLRGSDPSRERVWLCARYPTLEVKRAFGNLEMQENGETQMLWVLASGAN
jgi:hypothetical protein